MAMRVASLGRHLPSSVGASRALRAARRSCSQGAADAPPRPVHVASWLREHAASFAPPVMNKLLHRAQLSVMFVGGPNRREDFHMEPGSEFFYQLRGSMELVTVQAGQRRLVPIREGDVYLLPSRIPHSPQRPEEGSIGLVIERERYAEEPPDGLRFYTDFATCDDVLWERYFHCRDLGKDLVPIIAEFNASEEKATRRPTDTSVLLEPPLRQDVHTVVPDPFNLDAWLAANAAALDGGASLRLFGEHPDREFGVLVEGGRAGGSSADGGQQANEAHRVWAHETFLHQLRGGAVLHIGAERLRLSEGECVVLPAGLQHRVQRDAGSRGLVVTNDPKGNAGETHIAH